MKQIRRDDILPHQQLNAGHSDINPLGDSQGVHYVLEFNNSTTTTFSIFY